MSFSNAPEHARSWAPRHANLRARVSIVRDLAFGARDLVRDQDARLSLQQVRGRTAAIAIRPAAARSELQQRTDPRLHGRPSARTSVRAAPTGGSCLSAITDVPYNAFLRPQIAIVSARAGLLTPASTP